MPGSIKNPPCHIGIHQIMKRNNNDKERPGGGINKRIRRKRIVKKIDNVHPIWTVLLFVLDSSVHMFHSFPYASVFVHQKQQLVCPCQR